MTYAMAQAGFFDPSSSGGEIDDTQIGGITDIPAPIECIELNINVPVTVFAYGNVYISSVPTGYQDPSNPDNPQFLFSDSPITVKACAIKQTSGGYVTVFSSTSDTTPIRGTCYYNEAHNRFESSVTGGGRTIATIDNRTCYYNQFTTNSGIYYA